jgi:hypothetical protein
VRRSFRGGSSAILLSIWVGVAALAFGAVSPLAAQTPSNPRAVQPPPAAAPAAAASPASAVQPLPAANAPSTPVPALPPAPTIPPPANVVVPAGTRIAVALDTPLSTRISKAGQIVHFRTSEALPVAENFVIPQDTIFSGKVVEARRPGTFGKGGVLRVAVDRIELENGAGSAIAGRIEPTDPEANGRPTSDHSRRASLINLVMWSGQGALLGAQIRGGAGAAAGAGAGAAIAMIMMMAKHGGDVYLEPGTPFLITLSQPASLPGAALLAPAGSGAGSSAANARTDGSSPAWTSNSPSSGASTDPATDPTRPKLKHRPKPLL